MRVWLGASSIALRLLAPYLALAFFWCVLANGWAAILAYHAQIVFWSRKSLRESLRLGGPGLLALPAAAIGPLVFLLLPAMTTQEVPAWLSAHGLSRPALLAMIPYFGILHPLLEQAYWAPLRARTRLAHPLFAGYHMLVLYPFLKLPWLVSSFAVLTAASVLWRREASRSQGLATPIASHILADLGIVLAAWFRS